MERIQKFRLESLKKTEIVEKNTLPSGETNNHENCDDVQFFDGNTASVQSIVLLRNQLLVCNKIAHRHKKKVVTRYQSYDYFSIFG